MRMRLGTRLGKKRVGIRTMSTLCPRLISVAEGPTGKSEGWLIINNGTDPTTSQSQSHSPRTLESTTDALNMGRSHRSRPLIQGNPQS